jgi:hypothetical protein
MFTKVPFLCLLLFQLRLSSSRGTAKINFYTSDDCTPDTVIEQVTVGGDDSNCHVLFRTAFSMYVVSVDSGELRTAFTVWDDEVYAGSATAFFNTVKPVDVGECFGFRPSFPAESYFSGLDPNGV